MLSHDTAGDCMFEIGFNSIVIPTPWEWVTGKADSRSYITLSDIETQQDRLPTWVFAVLRVRGSPSALSAAPR